MGVAPLDFQNLFRMPEHADIVRGKASLVTVLDDFLPSIGFTGNTLDFIAYWCERDSHLNFQLLNHIKRLRAVLGVKLYLATNQDHLRANYL